MHVLLSNQEDAVDAENSERENELFWEEYNFFQFTLDEYLKYNGWRLRMSEILTTVSWKLESIYRYKWKEVPMTLLEVQTALCILSLLFKLAWSDVSRQNILQYTVCCSQCTPDCDLCKSKLHNTEMAQTAQFFYLHLLTIVCPQST